MPLLRRLLSYVGVLDNAGQKWVHNPLGIFCFCAACTHLGSMLTHIYPDSHTLVGPCIEHATRAPAGAVHALA